MYKEVYMTLAVMVIFGIIALLIAVYVLERQTEKKNIIYNNRISTLNEVQKRGLAYGAILALYVGEKEVFNLNEKINFNKCILQLKEQFGIFDHDSAISFLERLNLLSESDEINKRLVLGEYSKKVRLVERVARRYINRVNNDLDVYGVDVVRLSAIAKWAYRVNYISEAEFTYFMNECCNIIQDRGENFEQLTYSYLLGQSILGFDIMEVCVIAEGLLNSPNSPYRSVVFK